MNASSTSPENTTAVQQSILADCATLIDADGTYDENYKNHTREMTLDDAELIISTQTVNKSKKKS